MYYVNKIVWFCLNPLTIGLALVLAAVCISFFRRARAGRVAVACALAGALWLWLWSTPAFTALVGATLERAYLESDGQVRAVEDYPVCNAIVILGGGMSKASGMRYPEMHQGADRVWQGARLWKAGKAPRVLVSGCEELESSVPLLLDFGVPREKILVDNESRNTYENARFTERVLKAAGLAGRPRVLLVTSASHMPRACGNFSKTDLEVVPSPADFEATSVVRGTRERGWWAFLQPDAEKLSFNICFAKEWLGRLARK